MYLLYVYIDIGRDIDIDIDIDVDVDVDLRMGQNKTLDPFFVHIKIAWIYGCLSPDTLYL